MSLIVRVAKYFAKFKGNTCAIESLLSIRVLNIASMNNIMINRKKYGHDILTLFCHVIDYRCFPRVSAKLLRTHFYRTPLVAASERVLTS